MSVEPCPIPATGLRFSLPELPGMIFVRYPVATTPPEGQLAQVTGDGWQRGGKYRDGAWHSMSGQPFKREVLFWTIFEPPEARADG